MAGWNNERQVNDILERWHSPTSSNISAICRSNSVGNRRRGGRLAIISEWSSRCKSTVDFRAIVATSIVAILAMIDAAVYVWNQWNPNSKWPTWKSPIASANERIDSPFLRSKETGNVHCKLALQFYEVSAIHGPATSNHDRSPLSDPKFAGQTTSPWMHAYVIRLKLNFLPHEEIDDSATKTNERWQEPVDWIRLYDFLSRSSSAQIWVLIIGKIVMVQRIRNLNLEWTPTETHSGQPMISSPSEKELDQDEADISNEKIPHNSLFLHLPHKKEKPIGKKPSQQPRHPPTPSKHRQTSCA